MTSPATRTLTDTSQKHSTPPYTTSDSHRAPRRLASFPPPSKLILIAQPLSRCTSTSSTPRLPPYRLNHSQKPPSRRDAVELSDGSRPTLVLATPLFSPSPAQALCLPLRPPLLPFLPYSLSPLPASTLSSPVLTKLD